MQPLIKRDAELGQKSKITGKNTRSIAAHKIHEALAMTWQSFQAQRKKNMQLIQAFRRWRQHMCMPATKSSIQISHK